MSFTDLFPETLYETYCMENSCKLCFVCGRDKAFSVLRSVDREIAPVCKACSVSWNFYGYEIFKKTGPKRLIWNLFVYKYWHWFSSPSAWEICSDLKKFAEWGAKMKQFQKRRKENG
jgi:hypothetical protein